MRGRQAGTSGRDGMTTTFDRASGIVFPADAARRLGLRACRSGVVAGVVCFVICGAVLLRAYDVCLSRGMDAKVSEVVQNQVNGIAIAISDLVFGLDKGYVGYQA